MPAEAPFAALRGQLHDAAGKFGGGEVAAEILTGLVDDVDRALREALEIFPVCHHSPASAVAMARRLRAKQPKVIYLELCEDLQPLLGELANCTLPVALQAYASELDGFPAEWGPLSVIAPITEASAEYQAISYALTTPGVELVCVDHSADHVFQQKPPERSTAEPPERSAAEPSEPASAEPALHGDAVGVQLGDLRPRFAELEAFLLHHGKVRHWSEWWDQYVEQPLVGADHETYRQVMVLIGSLFRRLTPDPGRLAEDEARERYMWTRIRAHHSQSTVDIGDCLYVCGAFHAATRVDQFGVDSTAAYEIGPRTETSWLYGLIPSSHSAIEAQFGLAPGSVSIAAATWSRATSGRGAVRPYRLSSAKSGKTAKASTPRVTTATAPAEPGGDMLSEFLSAPSRPGGLDDDELRGWCVDLVRLARRNGYLASTADAIAVFETSMLLAGIRGRHRPTPYDFSDAAVTCIEKDTVPGRRDVATLCGILLGGDRIGRVGYDALPPLARDVYDRLTPLGLDLTARTQKRALLDLAAQPELRPCSDLLWLLRRLLPDGTVRPIMGERTLGESSVQESWDLALGRNQRSLIELGYDGVTVEQVLEQRLRRAAWDPTATAGTALAAVEDSILFLANRRFTEELGARAVSLLAAERTVAGAPDVLRRIRRLLTYYRGVAPTLPGWVQEFVTAGYAHYCTLLPVATVDEETSVRQVAAMLGFLFSMESLALSLGCDRAQLELAVAQSHPETPATIALLWAARYQLGLLTLADLRSRCDELLGNPLTVPSFPAYLSGFVQALDPAPGLTGFVVEALSGAFARLPDEVLLPWLPTLLTTLRAEAAELMPLLVREAGRTFPGSLRALDTWTPPWAETPPAPIPAVPAVAGPAVELLAERPDSCDAVAALLGSTDPWHGTVSVPPAGLLTEHPATATAVAALLD
ncbi:DUF5682 family protein [Actinocatenispora comari]|uniref:Uncharacterized protein n=1 Tax=Actinocatenispora comari TaxID=2807577 RepID=A0A8J4EPL9_9ACTN|nr:hypothetical protein NUM_67640 [Actinocatenispora comari]